MGCCILCARCAGVMWEVTGSVWDIVSSMLSIEACMHDVQALCGLLCPLCGLLQPPCGLSLSKTGNKDKTPRLRTKTKNGEQRIRRDKDGEKERETIFPGFHF